jgi:hypothetical protein
MVNDCLVIEKYEVIIENSRNCRKIEIRHYKLYPNILSSLKI